MYSTTFRFSQAFVVDGKGTPNFASQGGRRGGKAIAARRGNPHRAVSLTLAGLKWLAMGTRPVKAGPSTVGL
jgi:hypothetical protein